MTARLLPGFSPRLSPRLTAGLLTLLVWAVLAGSALYWWLRLGALAAPLQAPPAAAAAMAQPDSAQVARALGATPQAATAPPDDSVARRLALRGVLTHGGRGAALIAIDGKSAALPLRVGELLLGLDGGWRLQSVARHSATLAADGRALTLELPEPASRSNAGDATAPAGPAAPPIGLPRPNALPVRPAAVVPPTASAVDVASAAAAVRPQAPPPGNARD